MMEISYNLINESEAVSANALGQLEVLAHDGHTLGVDGAQVGVLEKRNQICLSSFLEGKHGLALETDLLLELSGDFADQALKGQLADEQVGLNDEGGTLFWNLRI